jgi:hypothetical protein
MKRFALPLGWLLVAGSAWAQPIPAGAPAPITTTFADRRAPGPTDDVSVQHFPGSDWIIPTTGQIWKAISTGAGQAAWQPELAPPLPVDVEGLYATAIAVQVGGTGWTTGDTVTFPGNLVGTVTAAAGVATAVAVTTPRMYACATANPVKATATSGSGVLSTTTFNLTLDIPEFYGRIRGSTCYTTAGKNAGALMQVTNSVTAGTLNVPFLANTNGYDYQQAFAFATGTTPQPEYQTWQSGPVPLVTTLYDTGGTTDYNASYPTGTTDITASVATPPMLFSGKFNGTGPFAAPPILFSGNGGLGVPASGTFMTIPSAVTIGGANATMVFAGTAGAVPSGFGYLGPSAGGQYFGIANEFNNAALFMGNTADTANVNTYFNTPLPETPAVFGVSVTGGAALQDTTFSPANTAPYIVGISGTPIAGTTAGISVYGGNTGVGSGNQILASYAETTADAAAPYPANNLIGGLLGAVNTNPQFAAAGIVCAPAAINYYGPEMNCYIPAGVAAATGWTFATVTNGLGSVTMSHSTSLTTGVGGTYAGGILGKGPGASLTGNVTIDAVLFDKHPITAVKQQRLRESLDYWLGDTPQISMHIIVEGASNTSGYQSAFGIGQSMSSMIPGFLGRSDVVVFNPGAPGTEMLANATAFASGITFKGINGNPASSALYWGSAAAWSTHLGGAYTGNNIVLAAGTYNDFGTGSYNGALSNTGVLTISGTVTGMNITKTMVLTGSGVNTTVTGTIQDILACNGVPCTGGGGDGTYMTNYSGGGVSSEALVSVGTPTALLASYQYLANTLGSFRAPGSTTGEVLMASPEPTKNAGYFVGAFPSTVIIGSAAWSATNGGQIAIVLSAASSVYAVGNVVAIVSATNSGTGGTGAINASFTVTSFTDSQHFTVAAPAAAGVFGTIGGASPGVGNLMAGQMRMFGSLLTPSICTATCYIVNPLTFPVLNGSSALQWTGPWYELLDSAGHVGIVGNTIVSKQIADTIKGFAQ